MEQTLVKEICPTTTQALLKEGALLVDVREIGEILELAYIVDAKLEIPLSQFEERFREIPTNRAVVVACRSGARSLRAAGFLINHGYTNVMNMQGGIVKWASKGFPTEGTASIGSADCCSSDNCC
jgi:rhodanese-related sulfurtransferase